MDSEEVDYFSFLPDALILIIITFLPFKEAVRTSVLSRRWRNLWESTKNIDLDEKFFVKNESSGENRAMQRRNFVGFIRRWMENYTEPDVEKYRLVISNPPEFYLPEVQECIRFSVDHREVKALDLDFSDPTWDAENLDIIPQMFICKWKTTGEWWMQFLISLFSRNGMTKVILRCFTTYCLKFGVLGLSPFAVTCFRYTCCCLFFMNFHFITRDFYFIFGFEEVISYVQLLCKFRILYSESLLHQ
ncbi:hypothetical protein Pfo_005153 [Paulownia fortunei]|nr:hypothetical protein Pfo_005153 [Paulownia fortunei]